VPIITIVIGEGGSGGALALAVADTVLMLLYAIYSVISPEGCAAILWKSADKAPEAAATLGITAQRLKSLGLVDRVISEPIGGAHRGGDAMSPTLRRAIAGALRPVPGPRPAELVAQRPARPPSHGQCQEHRRR